MRRRVKYATALMAGLMMTAWGGIIALAGEWNFTGPESWKWEYRDDNGSRAGAGWKEIDGSWYHFDSNGYLDTGYWRFEEGGPWYYLSEADDENIGKMVTSGEWEFGSIQPDGTFYCLIPMLDGQSGVVLCNYQEETGFQPVKTSTLDWYNDIFKVLAVLEPTDGEQITRQFQLPADWKTVCPNPFLSAMVSGGNFDAYTWSVNEENVLTVTGYYYY